MALTSAHSGMLARQSRVVVDAAHVRSEAEVERTLVAEIASEQRTGLVVAAVANARRAPCAIPEVGRFSTAFH